MKLVIDYELLLTKSIANVRMKYIDLRFTIIDHEAVLQFPHLNLLQIKAK